MQNSTAQGTFPAPPSGAGNGNGTTTRRGPYPYPYQGSYADPNATQSVPANPYTTANAAQTSSAAAVDPVKAERKRVHNEQLAQLIAKKEARDQAAHNVAQLRAELSRGSGGSGGGAAPSNAFGDEDVQAKSAEAKRNNNRKKNAMTSTDYLDFDNKFGGRTFNILSVALVVSALVLFYVLWFTNLVY